MDTFKSEDSCLDCTSHGANKASRRVQAGEVRPSELTEACLAQMDRSSWLNCFVARCDELARTEAEAADARQANGKLIGPLDGIPYAAKDNFCTLGVPTTASSAALAGFTPPYDSTPTRRLRQAGSPLLGKTNMDEFGMGSGNLFSCHGRTLNPWSPGPNATSLDNAAVYVPGGSSGGSAAAVSSGACFLALGSDTGGSVRMPAAFCGVVGMKPTYGLVPRHGLIAYASSLDTPGILARSVLDSAMVLDVIAGPDSKDSTCLPIGCARGFASALLKNGRDREAGGGLLEGLTVGVPKEFNVEELDAGARRAWEHAVRMAAALGAEVIEVSIPSVPQALGAYAVLASAEASSNLSRYDGLRYGERVGHALDSEGKGLTEGAESGMFRDQGGLHEEITRTRTACFGDEVKRRILTGCFVLCESAYHDYYELAIKIQQRLRREMHTALSVADVLLAPTTPFPPFLSGPPSDPVALLLNDVLTVPISLAGLPAISIPVLTVPASTETRDDVARDTGSGRVDTLETQGGTNGVGGEGHGSCLLPLGIQIFGRPLGEGAVLQVAHALEHQLDFASQVPERVKNARC